MGVSLETSQRPAADLEKGIFIKSSKKVWRKLKTRKNPQRYPGDPGGGEKGGEREHTFKNRKHHRRP